MVTLDILREKDGGSTDSLAAGIVSNNAESFVTSDNATFRT
jgi:hypothetical protein